MALHIIKSAQITSINEVENLITADDEVLLSDDGCYLYTLAAAKFNKVQALSDHMQSRGLLKKASDLGIELISIKQWALLTRNHQQILTW
jgi:sulfur relay protein TusB/DsrH